MKTAKVSDTIYQGAGYAVAAILGGEVIVASYIPGAIDRKPTAAELAAAYDAVMADPIYRAAYNAWQQVDEDSPLVDALYVDVSSGMMGSGEFAWTKGLADKRRMGLVA